MLDQAVIDYSKIVELLAKELTYCHLLRQHLSTIKTHEPES